MSPRAILLGSVVLLHACGNEPSGSASDLDPNAVEVTPSRAPDLNLKNHQQLEADLADALGLPAGEVCRELGQYSCTEQVHRLSLGGTLPYSDGRYEPLARTPVTGPIAVERIALAACITRVDRDLADPSQALIFRDLPFDGQALASTTAVAVTRSLERLVERALRRTPRGWEIQALRDLYTDALEHSERPARDWAVAACHSVITSTEQLFY